jgi:hypothetical protein
MFQGQVAVISNKATWDSRGDPGAIELYDEADGTTTDLADPALTVDIVVTIKDMDGCIRATASIDNAKVIIPGPGFYWQFEVDDLSALCAGNYKLGVKITIDDFVTDEIIGTVAVVEGN